MNPELQIVVDRSDVLFGLLQGGVMLAAVLVVVAAAIRIGWKYAGWVLIASLLVYYLM